MAIRLIHEAGGLAVVRMIARRGDALLLSAAVTNMGDTPLDPAELDQADAEALVEAVARYKGLRDRLHAGRAWLGEAPDGLVAGA